MANSSYTNWFPSRTTDAAPYDTPTTSYGTSQQVQITANPPTGDKSWEIARSDEGISQVEWYYGGPMTMETAPSPALAKCLGITSDWAATNVDKPKWNYGLRVANDPIVIGAGISFGYVMDRGISPYWNDVTVVEQASLNASAITFRLPQDHIRAYYSQGNYPEVQAAPGTTLPTIGPDESITYPLIFAPDVDRQPLSDPTNLGATATLTGTTITMKINGSVTNSHIYRECTPSSGHPFTTVEKVAPEDTDLTITERFHVYLVPTGDLTQYKSPKYIVGSWPFTKRIVTIDMTGAHYADPEVLDTCDFAFPNEQPTTVNVTSDNSVTITFADYWPDYLDANGYYTLLVIHDSEINHAGAQINGAVFTANGSDYPYTWDPAIPGPRVPVQPDYIDAAECQQYRFTSQLSANIFMEVTSEVSATLPDFRYWINRPVGGSVTNAAPSPPVAQPFLNNEETTSSVDWVIGDNGHWLTFGDYSLDGGLSVASTAYLWLAGYTNPIAAVNIVDDEGKPLGVATSYTDKYLYDDGVVTHLGYWTDTDGSYVLHPYVLRFSIDNTTTPLKYTAAPLPESFLQAYAWSSHTNDGGQEFICYTASNHPSRPYHIVAYDYEGNELWSSPTPLFNGPGSTPYMRSIRNYGSVTAIPRAGRFVWTNWSPLTWFAPATGIDWVPPYTQLVNKDTSVWVKFTLPDIGTDYASNFSVSVDWIFDGMWDSKDGHGSCYFGGKYVGDLSIPYNYGTWDRHVYNSWSYATSGYLSGHTYSGILLEADLTSSQLPTDYYKLDTSPSGYLRDALSIGLSGPNTSAQGMRMEIRGANDLIVATTTAYGATTNGRSHTDRACGQGIISIHSGSYPTGEFDPVSGTEIYGYTVSVRGISFENDTFADWPAIDARMPKGWFASDMRFDMHKGQIVAASHWYKGSNPT